jgi:phage terminase large subunit GpA-like protein
MLLTSPKHLLINRVLAGLQRNLVNTAGRWACEYRIMGQPHPGKWTFKWHPWLKEMHDSQSQWNIGRKAAQMGFTECCLNIVFFQIDVHGRSCLYILPATTPDATDFSSSRFDAALELSEHLENLFHDVKNVGHKRAGAANLFIRGSRSRSGLKSIPTPVIIFDEVDEMTQENLPLAIERASGQNFKLFWKISTPTAEGYGIDVPYQNSTKEIFHFKCPSCSKYTYLDFIDLKNPDCLVILGDNPLDPKIRESYLCCRECKNKLPQESKPEWLALSNGAKWIEQNHGAMDRGFWIPQLYSSTVAPWELAVSALKSQDNPAYAQELHNSKLGKPYTAQGARVNDSEIDEIITHSGNYTKQSNSARGRLVTMGVDVGKVLHYEIAEWFHDVESIITPDLNMYSKPKVISEGSVPDFPDLDRMMRDYQILMCVIDANPERRKAYEFAMRFFGHVKLCFYARGIGNKHIHVNKELGSQFVNVDRTSWMDLSLGRFHNGKIMLPTNITKEYRNHIKNPVRIYEKDNDGNPIGKYLGETDHLAHARTYNEIALPLAASFATNKDVDAFL